MRKIKFRGKSTETKLHTAQWRFGSLLTSSNEACKPLIYQRFPRPMHDGNGYWYEVDESTVGQYTGLKDISDAEIYEGDIVSFKDDETDECVRGLVTHSVDGTWLVVCDGFSEYLSTVRKTTLIMGNVYDSPELLESDHERD